MPSKSAKPANSKSKTEEPNWYTTPEGRLQTQREFARALKAGTLDRSSGAKFPQTDPKLLEQLMQQAKENATRAISIRIPIADIERAKRIAEKTGVGYQAILKRAIRDGLKRAGWSRPANSALKETAAS